MGHMTNTTTAPQPTTFDTAFRDAYLANLPRLIERAMGGTILSLAPWLTGVYVPGMGAYLIRVVQVPGGWHIFNSEATYESLELAAGKAIAQRVTWVPVVAAD